MEDRPALSPGPLGPLHEFAGRLLEALVRLQSAGAEGRVWSPALMSLTLAEAALRALLPPAAGTRPPQVVVLGPTQTGKSTVVNLLAGQALAAVSPLAGFTVHAQGFWLGGGSLEAPWIGSLFPGWTRRDSGDLEAESTDSFALRPAAAPRAPGLSDDLFSAAASFPECVVWDTPDFDSLAAHSYLRGVIEPAALADVHLLVVSREKYSDLSVWRMLELLRPLNRPLVICLNKLTPDSEGPLVASLRHRLADRGGGGSAVPIVALPYSPELAGGKPAGVSALAEPLRAAVGEAVGRLARDRVGWRRDQAAGVAALLHQHWDAWLEPVLAEHQAIEQWREMVSQAAGRFMTAYQRDYLDHPERYDSFRRASVELLNLLEIPRVGGVIAQVRQACTWPARQIIQMSRSWWTRGRQPRPTMHSLGMEAAVLTDTVGVLMAGLQRDIVRRAGADGNRGFWGALAQRWVEQQENVRQSLEAAIEAHHAQVTKEIRAVAYSLLQELKRSPARLTALRTARATLDLGSILLAIKTGGLTALDAVWAPAAFAVTSLLMEGAVGVELSQANRGLKNRQRRAVEELIDGTFVRELMELLQDLSGDRVTGLSPEDVEAATTAREAWERSHA